MERLDWTTDCWTTEGFSELLFAQIHKLFQGQCAVLVQHFGNKSTMAWRHKNRLSPTFFGVWSDSFWHPIHPWACAEWDVQCACNLVEWQLAFSESNHSGPHVVGDVMPLCFHGQSGNQTVFTTEGKWKKLSTQLITSISQNQFPMLSTTSSHPQSPIAIPNPPTSTHSHPQSSHTKTLANHFWNAPLKEKNYKKASLMNLYTSEFQKNTR